MKQGTWKKKGGGLKRKSALSASKPQGISRTRLGEIEVNDDGYMAALHTKKVQPLDIAPQIPKAGVTELHHTKAPVKHKKRRDFDSGVVPLDRNVHFAIEAGEIEERVFQPIFGAWSAFAYWCHHNNYEINEEGALAYQKWVLERMEEDDRKS